MQTHASHEAGDSRPQASVRRLEPLPADPLGRRLCETFSYRWQPILAAAPDDSRQKPAWQTLTRYPLRPRTLWNLWQDAGQLVGVRFGHTTPYALLDIDAQSSYHPAQSSDSLSRLRLALETIGLYRSILVRSSWSGGLHLYLPLPEAIATFDLAVALRRCLEAQGFGVCQGQLEVFPNVKRYGRDGQFVEYNAHRLPLQPASGSVLLNDDLQPIQGGLGRFFDAWDVAAHGQDLDELNRAIALARRQHRQRTVARSNVVESWQQDLLTEIETGWTGHGQTNHLLKTIACYAVVFKGLSGEALEHDVLHTALSRPGYGEWCRHQHDIALRAQVWAAAAAAYYWPLGATPKRRGNLHSNENNIVPFNRARAEDAQQRIQQAIATLTAEGTLPTGLTARRKAIATQAKCSYSTLQKHKPLWYDPQEPVTFDEQALEPTEPVQTAAHPKSSDSAPHQALHTIPLMKGCPEMASGLSPVSSSGEGEGRGSVSFPQGSETGSPLALIPQSPSPQTWRDQVVQSPQNLGDSGGARDSNEASLDLSVRNSSPWERDLEGQDPEVTLDLSDTIAAIQVRIQQLCWSADLTRQFIAAHFNGKRRAQLTDRELVCLLKMLQ